MVLGEQYHTHNMPQELLKRIQSQLSLIKEGVGQLPEGTDLSGLSAGIQRSTEMLKTPRPEEPMPTTALGGERPIEGTAPVPDQLTTAIQDVMTGTAGSDRSFQAMSEQLAVDAQKRDVVEEEKKGIVDRTKEFFEGRPTYGEMEDTSRAQFLKRFGLPAGWEAEQMQGFLQMQSEVVALRGQMDMIDVREQQELLDVERRMPGGLKSVARGEQAFIQRQYAIEKAGVAAELSSKAAVSEMYRGNVDMADRYTKNYIDAATFDLQQKKEEITWFTDYYSNEYNALDNEVKNSINSILNFVQGEEERERQELGEKMGLIRRAAEQGVNLGLSGKEIKTMSIEEINEFYSNRVSATVANKSETTSTGWGDFTDQEKRKLVQEGIDWTTPDGYTKALDSLYGGTDNTEDWDDAEQHIQKNIIAGHIDQEDILEIYADIRRNTGMQPTDIKTIMSQYGMVEFGNIWQYTPTWSVPGSKDTGSKDTGSKDSGGWTFGKLFPLRTKAEKEGGTGFVRGLLPW